MNEISKVFENKEFGKVRVVIIDGEPWFVGADVAKILNYADVSQAIRQNCKHAMKVDLYAKQGQSRGNSQVYIISESDVYRLVMRSKRPEAEKFEEWVVEEVLPSIRKTGSYTVPESEDILIARALIAAQGKIERLEAKVEEMQPKADYFDELVDSGSATNLRDTAKELKVPERDFIAWLEKHRYLYRGRKDGNLRPYAEYSKGDTPLFVIKDAVGKNGYGTVQTFVTIEGKDKLRKKLSKNPIERIESMGPKELIENTVMFVPVEV